MLPGIILTKEVKYIRIDFYVNPVATQLIFLSELYRAIKSEA